MALASMPSKKRPSSSSTTANPKRQRLQNQSIGIGIRLDVPALLNQQISPPPGANIRNGQPLSNNVPRSQDDEYNRLLKQLTPMASSSVLKVSPPILKTEEND